MSLNTPETHEFQTPAQEVLSKAQKAVLERIMTILDSDPKLKDDLNKTFERNFQEIIGDTKKFNLLLEKIGQTEIQKLGEIENQFNTGKINENRAKEESKKIIEKYTIMKLSALKSHIPTA